MPEEAIIEIDRLSVTPLAAYLLSISVLELLIGYAAGHAGTWIWGYESAYAIALATTAVAAMSPSPVTIMASTASGVISAALGVAGFRTLGGWPMPLLAALLLISLFHAFFAGPEEGYERLLPIPLASWFAWGFSFMLARLMNPSLPLYWDVVAYHWGIAVLCVNESLPVLGFDYEYRGHVSLLCLVVAVAGMASTALVRGAGLFVYPVGA